MYESKTNGRGERSACRQYLRPCDWIGSPKRGWPGGTEGRVPISPTGPNGGGRYNNGAEKGRPGECGILEDTGGEGLEDRAVNYIKWIS